MTSVEIWKPVKNYEEKYIVSSYGNVKNLLTRYEFKPCLRGGYYSVGLSKDNNKRSEYIHRLVAMSFIENPSNLPVVNHKNGNKLDNTLENLEFASIINNVRHAASTGLTKYKNKIVNKYSLDGQFLETFSSVKEASEKNGVTESALYCTLSGRTKTCKKFIWKYQDENVSVINIPDGKSYEDYENYIITRCGQVYNIKTKKYLKLKKTLGGYLSVMLYKNSISKQYYIHCLVAKTFIENPLNYPMINHIDGNKQNNNITNLEWCSFSHNMKHYRDLKKSKSNNAKI